MADLDAEWNAWTCPECKATRAEERASHAARCSWCGTVSLSRAREEGRRAGIEEALIVVRECASRNGLLNDEDAIVCGGEVFDRIRALASPPSTPHPPGDDPGRRQP